MKNIYIIILLAALLTMVGCNRHINSQDIPFNLPAQPPVPEGLQIIHASNGLNLAWQISDSSNIRYFKIYTADTVNGEYRFLDSTNAFSILLSGLTDGKAYFFKVSAVVKGPVEGAKSSTIATRPGIIAVVINNDDKYTRNQNVTLTFVVPVTANLVQVAPDSAFAGAQWQAFAPSFSDNLTSGDGTKRVYARFQFADGSQSDKGVSDSIILDTRAFIDSTYFTTTAPNPKAGDAATFFVVTHESGGAASISFANVSQLKCFDDGTNGDITANDGIYTRRFVIPSDLQVTNGLVTGNFQDAAGNAADPRSALTKINIIQTPATVTLTAIAESSSAIRLSWSLSNDNDFAAYEIFRSTTATVTTGSQLVAIIPSNSTTSIIDTNLNASTAYFYRVFVFNNSGLSTPSNMVSDTTLINLAPTAVQLASRTDGTSTILTWTVNNDADFASYQIFRDTLATVSNSTSRLLTIINSQGTTTFTDTRPDTTKFNYKIFVYDKQGLFTGSNQVSAP